MTNPEEEFITATAGTLLLHVPPAGLLLSVIADPTQTLFPPVIAAGSGFIVTGVVVVTIPQPPDEGIVYVTVKVPVVLVPGVIAPVDAFMLNPEGDELYVPPAYAPVPINVTGCAVVTDLQNGLPA